MMKVFNTAAVLLVAIASRSAVAFMGPQTSFQRASVVPKMVVENADAKDIKVGVIGAGRIGIVHLEAITKAPGVTPLVISNPTISKAEAGTFDGTAE